MAGFVGVGFIYGVGNSAFVGVGYRVAYSSMYEKKMVFLFS